MGAEALEGLTVKHLPVIGMGYRNQEFGSFLERTASKVHRPVLGNYPMRVGTGSHDSSSRIDFGNYLVLALVGARGKGCDALSALGHIGTADEIELPAGSRENPRTDGVGAYLAGEVNLGGRVDGLHMGVSGDYPGVVGIFDVLHQHGGVVVDEAVNLFGSEQERSNHLACIYFLALAVDYARPD